MKNGKQTVTDHPTKAAAKKAGMDARRKGLDAFAHSKADAAKFGLDPRTKGQVSATKRKAAVALKLLKGGKHAGAVGHGKKGPEDG